MTEMLRVKNAFPLSLRRVLLLGLCLRIVVIILFSHLESNFYWEYGEIAKNAVAGKGLSFYVLQNDSLDYHFSINAKPFPTALMSPGYVFFLIPFLSIDNVVAANILLILVQVIVSLVAIALVFHFSSRLFSPRVGLLSALAAAILPDFAYAVISFSPTVLFHLGLIVLFILLANRRDNFSAADTALLSFFCALLTYLRFEFIVYVFALPLLLRPSGKIKEGILAVIVTICMLLPWSIRNYSAFGEIVPLGTGEGLNLYRGNNAGGIGNWGDETTNYELLQIPKNRRFEIAFDSLFRERSWQFIRSHPYEDVKNISAKTFQLWLFSSLRPTPYDALYIVASLFVFIFFLIGIVKTWNWQKFNYLYVFLFYSTILAMVFFALPRHQTMMRIAMLPFFGAGVEVVWKAFNGSTRRMRDEPHRS